MSIRKDSLPQYELAVKNNKFLLTVNESASEVVKAREILGSSNSAQLTMHSGEELMAASTR